MRAGNRLHPKILNEEAVYYFDLFYRDSINFDTAVKESFLSSISAVAKN